MDYRLMGGVLDHATVAARESKGRSAAFQAVALPPVGWTSTGLACGLC